MEEQRQTLRAGAADSEKTIVDPDKTLVAPRFDAREAMTAQPVVPLDESHAVRPARRQGTLPLLLILVSALVGGLVSVFAYRLYQQRGQQPSAREQQQQPGAGEAAAAPAPTTEIPAGADAAEAPAPTPELIEEPQPTPVEEVAEVREAPAPEEASARVEVRENGAGRDLEGARERAAREEAREEDRPAARQPAARRPAARRVEEITTPTEDLPARRERREARANEAPARPRANPNRRAERRAERNIDRVRAIFEGSPPE